MHLTNQSTLRKQGAFSMLGKRAARDPETGKTILVAEDMNYREWEKKYGKSTSSQNNPVNDIMITKRKCLCW